MFFFLKACPSDAVKSSAFVCRPAPLPCDKFEFCDGSSKVKLKEKCVLKIQFLILFI